MIVKICGLTTLEDARLAHGAGADLLGLVFAESPRRVSLEQAARLCDGLRTPDVAEGALVVGVFVDAPAQEVVAAARRCALDYVQLHGQEDAAYVRELHKGLRAADLGTRILAVLRPRHRAQLGAMMALARLPEVDGFIVEPVREARAEWDWSLASELCSAAEKMWLIAGGLEPGNVALALRRSQAHGADVASGVERSPGKKDPDKLRHFIAEVRRVQVSA